jgi:hypothetical protein
MSRENVELAYRAIDAFNRRDLGGFLSLMDDDVEGFSRIVAIEGACTATTACVDGGTAG